MNEIKVFENEHFGQVRTVSVDKEPWFVAADVCRVLDHSNVTMALDRLDVDEKAKFSLGLSGGDTNCVNEPGLYALVLGSRKPEAKAFKRWITHDVIPSIRKTGQYRLPSLDENIRSTSIRAEAMLLNAKSRQADLWNKFADKLDSKEHKQICASYGTEVLAGHRVIPLPEVDKSYSASEVGKLLGISANAVGRIANQNGLKTNEYGYYALDKSAHSNKEVEVFRYNERGVAAVKSHM